MKKIKACIKLILQSHDCMPSCGSWLCPVGWRSDFLERCHSLWQFGILEFQNQKRADRSPGVSSDCCFRSLRSSSNQKWLMCVCVCTQLCVVLNLHAWSWYVCWYVTSHPSLFQNDTDDTLCYKNTLKLHHRVSRVGVVVDVEEKQVCKMLTLILFLSCFLFRPLLSPLPPSTMFQWVLLTTCHRRGYMKTATTSNLTSGR